MAQTYRQQHLNILARNERAMRDLFAGLHARIMAHIHRAASGPDQTIPPQDSQRVRAAISAEVLNTFVSPTPQGPQAFTVTAGRVMPLSPYMRVLWPLMEQAVQTAVAEQGAIMNRALRRAPDVLTAWLQARRNPLVVARQVQEQTLPRRPFSEYDPLHRFVDPRGYRLSDRIWDTATVTRRKIDQLLTEMIAEGRSSLEISRELEQFLTPGHSIVRTKKPYGTSASFDSMRLARTEITAAGARAHKMAALMNPFVEEYDIVLSNSHKILDECDIAAAGSPYRWDDPKAPHIPLHPQDLCHERDRVRGDVADIIADLRAELMDPPAWSVLQFVTPLLVERFARMLLDEPEFQAEELF